MSRWVAAAAIAIVATLVTMQLSNAAPSAPKPIDHNRPSIGFQLDGSHATVACESCHKTKNNFKNAPRNCSGCHGTPPHAEGITCAQCHNTTSWIQTTFTHDKTNFPLDGKHNFNINASCDSCHAQIKRGEFEKSGRQCTLCHKDTHGNQFATHKLGCLECHNSAAWSPSTIDAKRHSLMGNSLKGMHVGVPCAACHTDGKFVKTPTACASCHTDPHGGKFAPRTCESCHDETSWQHTPHFDHQAVTGFALTDGHKIACASCHASDGKRPANAPARTCASCHTSKHGNEFSANCTQCHNSINWKQTPPFDHRQTMFPLDRRHNAVACVACHDQKKFPRIDAQCTTCHDDPHRGRAQRECDDCHRADRWTMIRFDHDRSEFPLRGRHFPTPCRDCHVNDEFTGVRSECIACHRVDQVRANNTNLDHRTYSFDCSACHKPFKW